MVSAKHPVIALVLLVLGASIAACSKKDDAGAPSPVPPLSQGAPAPAAAPPPAATQPPPAPPPAALPAPEGAAAALGGGGTASEGGTITGKI